MTNLQVKNLPEDLDRRLHDYAEQHNRTIRDIVLEAVRRELDRRAFVERLAQRPPTRLPTPPSALLAMERRERDSDL